MCYYDCVFFQLVLLESTCPLGGCPTTAGPCGDSSGLIVAKDCPD